MPRAIKVRTEMAIIPILGVQRYIGFNTLSTPHYKMPSYVEYIGTKNGADFREDLSSKG